MKYKIGSFLAAAAIFTTVTTTAQAEQVIVQKGDTLWGISQEHGVSVESIKKWNHLSSDIILPNDVLEVSPIKNVTVRKGDTLWNIAQVYGVSVDEVKKWNELNSDLIHPGLKLVIYTDLAKDVSATANVVAQNNHSTSAVNPSAAVTQKAEVQANTPVAKESSAAPAANVGSPENAAPATNASSSAPSKNAAPATNVSSGENQKESNPAPVEQAFIVTATAYTANCNGCSGITSTGVNLKANPDAKVISVDPSVIPLGSKVHVEGYGYATAADTGGAIKGNKIDVFIPNHNDAIQWGRKQVKVTIIE
ncbi:LysM peptidoglycan-binding domain-containing protein [Bacillus sp. B15-48]|uniref:LysM peptidoglycan-binding domain-containing protein n=1 Tax=Bacillus sp. B15-48 TaxID=1548601 RepID=UPI00193F3211|nr:LysM peptidoglycan-binding domain-containing protein [Bacillus sp. B15-48]MBM4760991.1 LysM peptidoglycan-binding domain-containing protein [Bacillus sp. B15-48]